MPQPDTLDRISDLVDDPESECHSLARYSSDPDGGVAITFNAPVAPRIENILGTENAIAENLHTLYVPAT